MIYAKDGVIIDNNKRNLVIQLTNRLENRCNNQLCWLKQAFVKSLKDNDLFNNTFRPINISADIRLAFRENADRLGLADPLDTASSVIQDIQSQMRDVSLNDSEFPFFENPLLPILQDTPATPTSLNLPGIDSNIVNNPGAAGSFSNLTTAEKLRILFPQG